MTTTITTTTTFVRRAGVVGAVGGALTAVSGLVVAGIVQPASDVPTDMWSDPWSPDALIPVSLLFAGLHALVAVGLLGLAGSGAAGDGRSGRVGVAVAIVGTVVLLVAELASIPIAGHRDDETGPGIVSAVFGIGTLLSAVGLLVAGVATVRAARWQGWRRFAPLATGVALTVLLGLVMTPALAAGIGLYGVGILAIGIAVATQPVPMPSGSRVSTIKV